MLTNIQLGIAKTLVLTDLAVEILIGCYWRIAPRSGLAKIYGIDGGAGVIDQDFRGNLGVVLFNHSNKAFNRELLKNVLIIFSFFIVSSHQTT